MRAKLYSVFTYALATTISLVFLVAISTLVGKAMDIDKGYCFISSLVIFLLMMGILFKSPLFFQFKEAVKEIELIAKDIENIEQTDKQELITCQADLISLEANFDSLQSELDSTQANEKRLNKIVSELRSELETAQSQIQASELRLERNDKQNKAIITQLQSQFQAAEKVMKELQPTTEYYFLVECGITPENVISHLSKNFLNGIKNGKTTEQKETIDKHFKTTVKI